MNKTEQLLEFDKVKRIWAQYALTEAAKQRIAEVVLIAEKGDCLSVEQLILVQNALTAVERLKSYLNRGKVHEISLSYYEENLEALADLREMIYLQIVNERVADNASKLLKSLRSDITAAESKMREKADMVIRSNKECMSDSYSTFRNGHICVPVKKEYKFRISGSIIDKSSTGNTLFVEPQLQQSIMKSCKDYG